MTLYENVFYADELRFFSDKNYRSMILNDRVLDIDSMT